MSDQREPRDPTTISNYAARTSARAEQKTEIARTRDFFSLPINHRLLKFIDTLFFFLI